MAFLNPIEAFKTLSGLALDLGKDLGKDYLKRTVEELDLPRPFLDWFDRDKVESDEDDFLQDADTKSSGLRQLSKEKIIECLLKVVSRTVLGSERAQMEEIFDGAGVKWLSDRIHDGSLNIEEVVADSMQEADSGD